MLSEHERFVKSLEDTKEHEKHKKQYDNYPVSGLSKFFGNILINTLNLIYGARPSYQKFKAIELVARIPYQSWEMVSYWLMTFFFTSEEKSIKYSKASDFGKIGQDNETMHVVVASQICKQEGKGNIFWHTFIPVIMSHVYFVFSYVLFVVNPRFSYELNYLFEQHAYEQYDEFIQNPELKKKKLKSQYLEYYGRKCKTQYDFFLSVRNDELAHRNNSIIEIECLDEIGKKKWVI